MVATAARDSEGVRGGSKQITFHRPRTSAISTPRTRAVAPPLAAAAAALLAAAAAAAVGETAMAICFRSTRV